jgi:hypothetical protein
VTSVLLLGHKNCFFIQQPHFSPRATLCNPLRKQLTKNYMNIRENLVVIKEIVYFYGTLRFITMYRRAHH